MLVILVARVLENTIGWDHGNGKRHLDDGCIWVGVFCAFDSGLCSWFALDLAYTIR